MRSKRFTDEQIVAILKEAEAGTAVTKLARRHGVSKNTIYHWRKKFGGMDVSDARRLRQLEEENARLKKIVAEQALDNEALRSVLKKKW